jgi:hypothetical protein
LILGLLSAGLDRRLRVVLCLIFGLVFGLIFDLDFSGALSLVLDSGFRLTLGLNLRAALDRSFGLYFGLVSDWVSDQMFGLGLAVIRRVVLVARRIFARQSGGER